MSQKRPSGCLVQAVACLCSGVRWSVLRTHYGLPQVAPPASVLLLPFSGRKGSNSVVPQSMGVRAQGFRFFPACSVSIGNMLTSLASAF